MRQETSETTSTSQAKIIECSYDQKSNKMSECQDVKYYSNDDVRFMISSNDSLNVNVSDDKTRKLNISPKPAILTEEESARILRQAKIKMETVPEEKRHKWLIDLFTEHYSSVMPASLIELTAANYFDGDSGNSVDVKPDWLDIEKFYCGQKLAVDNFLGVSYSHIISTFILFTFDDDLGPVIFTDMSSTPYTAFKRHLSTVSRMQTWYESDPWMPGTPAYNNIRTVRRIHSMVRKKIQETSIDEYKKKSSIKDAWCPAFGFLQRDLESTCPTPKPGQCPYLIGADFPELHKHRLNQCDMSVTQFAFTGILALNPKFFGIHDATDEDLECYLHMWRGLGYLLGIDDEFNFCRGSLKDVRTRSRDLLEYWARPNLRTVRPEWEHMMRCMVEGVKYYFPLASYETCLLDMAKIVNLHMPRTYETLSFVEWMRHNAVRFYFNQGSKLSGLKAFMNRQLQAAFDRARNYDKAKHQKLKERYERTIHNGTKRKWIPSQDWNY